MKKKATVKIKTKEETIEEKVELEVKNNKINYKEENKTIVLLDLESKTLMRENKKLYMEYDFFKEKGNIYIKSLRKNIELQFKLKKMNINRNKIEVQYEIENNLYTYKIEMED